VEAGLRSFDRSMPEEINRVVTDQLSQLLFGRDSLAMQIHISVGRERTKKSILSGT
jgi:UDP-N-acetylglucosamine 2-epimerase